MKTVFVVILLASIAVICNGQILVFMKNEHRQEHLPSFLVSIAPNATIRDLEAELFKFPSEISGIPDENNIAIAITIRYQGQVLDPNELLSDVGVGNEALLFYQINYQKITSRSLVVSIAEVLSTRIFCHGDVLHISNLKPQQNKSLQHIVKCMNNSLGIMMNPSMRTRRNRKEARLQFNGFWMKLSKLA